MHFHFQLANHYFFGIFRLDDILAPIMGGLRELGYQVTSGILPRVPEYPSILMLVEYFERDETVEEVIALKKAGGKRHCVGLLCTEDIADDLVMQHPDFPKRRANLLRVLPYCDFVWHIVPSDYAAHVPADRLAFVDFGYVEALRGEGRPAAGRDIDVLFYATINDRRRVVMEGLKRRGLNVAATRGLLPGYIRRNLVSRSKVVLDMRRGDDVRFTSPSRICAALQMGSTVVSETFDVSRLGALYGYTQPCAVQEIEERCAMLARDPGVLQLGLDARERFRREMSMASKLRQAMTLPIFGEIATKTASAG